MSDDKKPPWTQDQIAIAKAVLALHGQPLDDFDPVQPSEEFMDLIRKMPTRQLQWLLMEILSTMRRKSDELYHH
jgi:hypothetical protein